MRKVEFKVYENKQFVAKVGYFHQWGMEAIESECGNVCGSVGIVEEANTGMVYTVHPENIKFITLINEEF